MEDNKNIATILTLAHNVMMSIIKSCKNCKNDMKSQNRKGRANKFCSFKCYTDSRKGTVLRGPKNPLYRIWVGMMSRCNNKDHKSYKNYGARGISVCDRWYDFEKFAEDIVHRPSDQHTIDRIDNNGNYSPDNCKWSTWEEQNNNARGNRPITYKNKTLNLSQWARYLNVTHNKLGKYLSRNSFEKAIKHYSILELNRRRSGV